MHFNKSVDEKTFLPCIFLKTRNTYIIYISMVDVKKKYAKSQRRRKILLCFAHVFVLCI